MVFIVVYEPMVNNYPQDYARRIYGPFSDHGSAHEWRIANIKGHVKWDVVTYHGLDVDDADRR